jgi:hypothetical protein
LDLGFLINADSSSAVISFAGRMGSTKWIKSISNANANALSDDMITNKYHQN